MKAMILAAGRGTRMGTLTDKTPKPLLPLAGMPLIEYHVRALAAANIRELVINVSWLGDQIIEQLGTGRRFGVDIAYSKEPERPLETAGGIAFAMEQLGSEPFVVVNGDVWTDFPLHVLRDHCLTEFGRHDQAHLVMVKNPEHNPEGDFYFSQERVDTAFEPVEVCSKGRLHRSPIDISSESGEVNQLRFTFSGLGCYRPEFFASVNGRQALGPLLSEGIDKQRISATRYGGLWWDVGTPQRLQEVEAFLKEG